MPATELSLIKLLPELSLIKLFHSALVLSSWPRLSLIKLASELSLIKLLPYRYGPDIHELLTPLVSRGTTVQLPWPFVMSLFIQS